MVRRGEFEGAMNARHVLAAAAGAGAVAAIAIWIGNHPTDSVQAATSAPSHEEALSTYAKLPLAFVENRGQRDPRVAYYARGSHVAFYFTQEEVVLALGSGPAKEPGTATRAGGWGEGAAGFVRPAAFTGAGATDETSEGVAL